MIALGTWLWGKLQGWAVLIGAVLVALLTAYAKGRRGGLRDAGIETQKKTQKVQDKFNEIDRKRPDFDGAISKLRKRSLDP